MMRLPVRITLLVVLTAASLSVAWIVNRASSSGNMSSRIQLGSQLHFPAIDFGSADHTLLIFSNSACQYCIDNLDLYRSLLTETSSMARAIPIVMLSAEPVETFRLFMKRHGMNPSQIVSLNPSQLGVRIVPTILLVDRSGRVKRVWVGRKSKETQSAILSAVQNTQY